MASSKQVLLLAMVACLASLAVACKQWVVGDDCGWKKDFDQGWVNGKTFVVGDTLLFNYEEGKHSVAQVASENDFNTCNKDGNKIGQWCSGYDVVTLDKPGRAWFICTKGDHCSDGMKFAIDVVPAPGSGAAPPPPYFGWPFPGMAPPPPSPFGWPYPGTTPPPPPIGWPYQAPPPPPAFVWPSPVAVSPPSAAVRNPVGATVAVVTAAVVAALVF